MGWVGGVRYLVKSPKKMFFSDPFPLVRFPNPLHEVSWRINDSSGIRWRKALNLSKPPSESPSPSPSQSCDGDGDGDSDYNLIIITLFEEI